MVEKIVKASQQETDCSIPKRSCPSHLYRLLDHEWKEGMSQQEVEVVSLAMARDGATGGVVCTVTEILALPPRPQMMPGILSTPGVLPWQVKGIDVS
ncbi:hypothetical protein E2562_038706 [Oryza meyeriana var. granulata]|uniref:Uncharacterized protein n=1 Tax=Oryza meyeriana var. granulata TaxID=110450 RepID=A0A6G1CYE0_9ORYZ|nr:hypothetical protein E2562_038706 [Oryza meyeriana var. granulata]